MQPMAQQSPLSAAWCRSWGRLFRVMRPRERHRAWRHDAEASITPALDPIALTIVAVNRLGPATMRAVSSGMPVTVAAPDARTAEIFRAALSQMGKSRPTDRLVSVELIDSQAVVSQAMPIER